MKGFLPLLGLPAITIGTLAISATAVLAFGLIIASSGLLFGLLLPKFVVAAAIVIALLIGYQLVKSFGQKQLTTGQFVVGSGLALLLIFLAPTIAESMQGVPLLGSLASTKGATFAAMDTPLASPSFDAEDLWGQFIYFLAAAKPWLLLGIGLIVLILGAYSLMPQKKRRQ